MISWVTAWTVAKEAATWANAAWLIAGGLVHKIGAWGYAEWQKAKAEEKKVVAEVKAEVNKL